jgi:hypothetical protein
MIRILIIIIILVLSVNRIYSDDTLAPQTQLSIPENINKIITAKQINFQDFFTIKFFFQAKISQGLNLQILYLFYSIIEQVKTKPGFNRYYLGDFFTNIISENNYNFSITGIKYYLIDILKKLFKEKTQLYASLLKKQIKEKSFEISNIDEIINGIQIYLSNPKKSLEIGKGNEVVVIDLLKLICLLNANKEIDKKDKEEKINKIYKLLDSFRFEKVETCLTKIPPSKSEINRSLLIERDFYLIYRSENYIKKVTIHKYYYIKKIIKCYEKILKNSYFCHKSSSYRLDLKRKKGKYLKRLYIKENSHKINAVKSIINFWKNFQDKLEPSRKKEIDPLIETQESSIKYMGPSYERKIYLIGDVHGDFNQLLFPLIYKSYVKLTGKICFFDLQKRRIISEDEFFNYRLERISQRIVVIPEIKLNKDFKEEYVFLGDYIDRELLSMESLAFIYILFKKDFESGNRKICGLLGNHEVFVLLGDENAEKLEDSGMYERDPIKKRLMFGILKELVMGKLLVTSATKRGIMFTHARIFNSFIEEAKKRLLPDHVFTRLFRQRRINFCSSIYLNFLQQIIRKSNETFLSYVSSQKYPPSPPSSLCSTFLQDLVSEIGIFNAREINFRSSKEHYVFTGIQSASGHSITDGISSWPFIDKQGKSHFHIGRFDRGSASCFRLGANKYSLPTFSAINSDGSVTDIALREDYAKRRFKDGIARLSIRRSA